MSSAWNIQRLRIAAPELARSIEAIAPALTKMSPVSVDVLELAASRISGPDRAFGMKLVERLRTPSASAGIDGLLQGMRSAVAPTIIPALAWEKGASSQPTSIGEGEAIEIAKTLVGGKVLTIGPGRAIFWNADGSRGATCLIAGNEHVIMYDGAMLLDGRVLLPEGDNLHLFNPDGTHSGTIDAKLTRMIRVATFPDGRIVVSGENGKVRLLSSSHVKIADMQHASSVFALAVTPDERILTGCADSHFVRVFDATGKQLGSFEGHQGFVRCIAVWPDGRVVTGSKDKTARVWSPAGACSAVLAGHTSDVAQVIPMPGNRVLTVGDDGLGIIFDTLGNELARLENGAHKIKKAALLGDGRIYTHDAVRSTGLVWAPKD